MRFEVFEISIIGQPNPLTKKLVIMCHKAVSLHIVQYEDIPRAQTLQLQCQLFSEKDHLVDSQMDKLDQTDQDWLPSTARGQEFANCRERTHEIHKILVNHWTFHDSTVPEMRTKTKLNTKKKKGEKTWNKN